MLRRLMTTTRWELGLMLLLTASAAGLGLESGASPALAGGGCHQPTTQDAAGDAVFMEGMCFTPTVLRVQPGTKVTFLNKDETLHQVNGINWAGPGTLRIRRPSRCATSRGWSARRPTSRRASRRCRGR